MFKEGDIVRIPLPDGRNATALILHMSTLFKDGVGFIVFGIEGNKGMDVVYNVESTAPVSMSVLGPLYTHVSNLSNYNCSVISHQPLSDRLRALTRRLVGGGVYVGDDYLGRAEDLGDNNVKQMLFCGMPAVYAIIENAFGAEKPNERS